MKVLNVSLSPHIRSGESTRSIMLDVIIALLPCLGMGVVVFGVQSLLVIAISVISCVASEYFYCIVTHSKQTAGDLSAVVTGLILAANLYSTAPWYIPLLGGIFAIIIVKMLFGGLGQNFMNPALAARCFLVISFAKAMTNYPLIDGMSSSTPLVAAKNGELIDILDLVIGTHSGTIGETSVIALLIGGLYLIFRRVIRFQCPLSVILSTAVFVGLFTLVKDPSLLTVNYLLVNALGGGLWIGAIFMASDYATTPVTKSGQIIFGIAVGFITAFIRVFGQSGEGMSFAIILCNLLTPVIEKFTYPKVFGVYKNKIQKESK